MANYEVVLQGGSPWGIRLQGGADFNIPIKVAQVATGSKAESNGVLAESFLLEINGNKTTHLTMAQAQTLIKMTGNELVVLLNHSDKAPAQCARFVIIKGGKPWGFRLQGGLNSGSPLMVGQITSGGKVEKHGLNIGDKIISINGISTDGLTMGQSQNIIKDTGEQLTLGIPYEEEKQEDSNEDETEGKKKAPFMNELKETIDTRDANWGKQHEAKGNTFLSLQEHTDAGLGRQVRTVFDVAAPDRNKSIPVLAPKLANKRVQNKWDVTMVGGKPWGVRLQGGAVAGTPLQMASVTLSSKAALAGLVNGDLILAINDINTDALSMIDAQNLIKDKGVKLKLSVRGEREEEGPTDKEIDDAFYEDLKKSMQQCSVDGPKGNSQTFKKLQSIVDEKN